MKLVPDKIAKTLGTSSYRKIGKMINPYNLIHLPRMNNNSENDKPIIEDLLRRAKSKVKQECLIEKFFKEQEKLPESMRSRGAMISCPCKRCNSYTL